MSILSMRRLKAGILNFDGSSKRYNIMIVIHIKVYHFTVSIQVFAI